MAQKKERKVFYKQLDVFLYFLLLLSEEVTWDTKHMRISGTCSKFRRIDYNHLTTASRFFSGKNKLKSRTSNIWKEVINGSKKSLTGDGQNIIS